MCVEMDGTFLTKNKKPIEHELDFMNAIFI